MDRSVHEELKKCFHIFLVVSLTRFLFFQEKIDLLCLENVVGSRLCVLSVLKKKVA